MSLKNANPLRHYQPDIVVIAGTLIGANDADPTVEEGKGFTATRSAEGKYLITLANTVNDMICAQFHVGAATPSDVAGYTAHGKLISSSVVEVWVYNASQALADIITAQHLHFALFLRDTAVEI